MMPTCEILIGDVRAKLREIPDESVQCVVTSPPYWRLRDYGHAGQIGLEPTFAEWLDNIREVFREVKRVLRADGTAWVNMGDSYATGTTSERKPTATGKHGYWENPAVSKRINGKDIGLKPKDLIGQPWRLAFALQADGWYLRSDIIWHKPNPMPESVTDRPTKAHEYIFLLTKSDRYHYDAEAIVEKCSPGTHARLAQNVAAQVGSDRAHAGGKTNGRMKAVSKGSSTIEGSAHGRHALGDEIPARERRPGVNPKAQTPQVKGGSKQNESWSEAMALQPLNRNKRTVWTVPTAAFKDAHFATFPPDLIRPCILAGCPVGGTVLDPFFGSGTTGMVSLELGRSCIGIELNPAYAEMARLRCANVTPGLAL